MGGGDGKACHKMAKQGRYFHPSFSSNSSWMLQYSLNGLGSQFVL
jgi:hypothetical protein